jgi:hypothetical protein
MTLREENPGLLRHINKTIEFAKTIDPREKADAYENDTAT